MFQIKLSPHSRDLLNVHKLITKFKDPLLSSFYMTYTPRFPPRVTEKTPFSAFSDMFPFPDKEIVKAEPILGLEKEGHSPVFRNHVSKDGLLNCLHPKILTIYHVFEQVVSHYGSNEFLGRRKVEEDGTLGPYVFETYAHVAAVRDAFGSGLLDACEELGIPTKQMILSLYSANTYEWMVTDLACHAYGLINTTLYDSLGPSSLKHILSLTETPVIVLTKSKISTILDLKKETDFPHLKVLVLMEDLTLEENALYEQCAQANLKLFTFHDLVARGKKAPRAHIPPSPEDVLTISFTSGSTGVPKGVELTHEAFLCGITFCFVHARRPKNPTTFSFLPLAHVLERYKVAFEIAAAARVALPSSPGDVKSYLPDIKALSLTTQLCAVPRVYLRIEQGVKNKLAAIDGFKGSLVRSVISFKQFWDFKLGANGKGIVNLVIDKVFLSKIKEQVGFSDMDFFICGGAPVSELTVKFIRLAFGTGFYYGYGLTESFAAISLSRDLDTNLKCVGPIGVTCELRLRDVPELGYSWEKNRSGEILLKGPQIFKKYYKDEGLTKEVFDEDGFFKTGDVGQLDSNGNIEVIDRVKNFFKLAQGEYIAVERIENAYLSSCGFMEQLFIHGDSLRDHLVAIVGVVPQTVLDAVSDIEEYKNCLIEEISKLLETKDEKLRKVLLKKANDSVAGAGLFGFEKIKNAFFLENPLTIENDCVTPTMKLKRLVAKKVHQENLDALYA